MLSSPEPEHGRVQLLEVRFFLLWKLQFREKKTNSINEILRKMAETMTEMSEMARSQQDLSRLHQFYTIVLPFSSPLSSFASGCSVFAVSVASVDFAFSDDSVTSLVSSDLLQKNGNALAFSINEADTNSKTQMSSTLVDVMLNSVLFGGYSSETGTRYCFNWARKILRTAINNKKWQYFVFVFVKMLKKRH